MFETFISASVNETLRKSKYYNNLVIKDERFYPMVFWDGSVGACDAYVLGYWDVQDIPLHVFIKDVYENLNIINSIDSVFYKVKNIVRSFLHKRKNDSREDSVENISHHYDISNSFYERVLGATPLYSCGFWALQKDEYLASRLDIAQDKKLAFIEKTFFDYNVQKVLEIGAGWGKLGSYLTNNFDYTGLTISKEQLEYCQNLGINVKFSDYQDYTQTHDAVIALEIAEHISDADYEKWFAAIAANLKNGGICLMQDLIVHERDYDKYKNSVEWVKLRIFPGGNIPSLGRLIKAASKSNMRLVRYTDVSDNGYTRSSPYYVNNYSKTLLQWADNIRDNFGLESPQYRAWYMYFHYFTAAYNMGVMLDGIMIFMKDEPSFK